MKSSKSYVQTYSVAKNDFAKDFWCESKRESIRFTFSSSWLHVNNHLVPQKQAEMALVTSKNSARSSLNIEVYWSSS